MAGNVTSTPGGLDFRTGIENVSYAASGKSAPSLPLNRPSLSEQAVPSKLSGLFLEKGVETHLLDSLKPKEMTTALLSGTTYTQHLSNLRGCLEDLKKGYPRSAEAFQSGIKLVDEVCEDMQLLEVMRRVLVGG